MADRRIEHLGEHAVLVLRRDPELGVSDGLVHRREAVPVERHVLRPHARGGGGVEGEAAHAFDHVEPVVESGIGIVDHLGRAVPIFGLDIAV